MSTVEYLLTILVALAVGAWVGYRASKWIWHDEWQDQLLIEGYQMARQEFTVAEPEPELEPWALDQMLERGR